MALVNIGWYYGCLHQLLNQPFGIYGISYDIYTRPSEDSVPNGWGSHRSKTYKELISALRDEGYFHHQYSDHRNLATSAGNTFMVVVELTGIKPPSRLSTTVKGMKLHHISDMNLFDVSVNVQLGANAAQRLAGPAPYMLVNRVAAGRQLSQAPQPVPQGHPGVPPKYTRATAASTSAGNYVM